MKTIVENERIRIFTESKPFGKKIITFIGYETKTKPLPLSAIPILRSLAWTATASSLSEPYISTVGGQFPIGADKEIQRFADAIMKVTERFCHE